MRHRAFTLIELLVVVAILSLLAMTAIPLLLSVASRAPAGPERHAGGSLKQAPLQARAFGAKDGEAALPPALLSCDVEVALEPRQVVTGLEVTTLYTSRFDGRFVLRNQDREADRVDLWFPFPPGVTEAHDVRLEARLPGAERLRGGSKGGGAPLGRDRRSPVDKPEGLSAGLLVEPTTGVRYRLDGIAWSTPLAPGQSVEVRIRYRAAGRDAFRYTPAGPSRVGRLAVSLVLPEGHEVAVPASALPPTSVDTSADGVRRLRWELENLVTDRPIEVALPGGQSPLGRLIRLGRLFGLFLFLFAGGFWYLAEGYRPGALTAFRWPHLTLLGATFFVFFPVHAVATLLVGPAVAIALGAAISLPLLGLHVARFVDRRFALTRSLPLAALTLAATLAAGLTDGLALPIAVSVGVLALAWVTITYPRWRKGRTAAARTKSRLQERKEASTRIASVRRAIDQQHATLRELAAELDDGAFHARMGRLEEDDRLQLVERKALLDQTDAHDRFREEAQRLCEALERHGKRLERAIGSGRNAVASWEDARLRKAEASPSKRPTAPIGSPGAEDTTRLHCSACAASLDPGDRFCRGCGQQREVAVRCATCRHTYCLPPDLLREGWESALPHFCTGCGASTPSVAAVG